MEGITQALMQGAKELKSIPLKNDAPPAFLIDYKRMSGPINAHGMYDNRSWVFPQDMPSVNFLLESQIRNVIVLQENNQPIAIDLSHIVCRYQEGGLGIFRYNIQDNSCEPIKVKPPSQFKILVYRFATILGLERHGGGGFGRMIPEPTDSRSSTRYRHRSG